MYTAIHLELLTGSSSSLTPFIVFCFGGAFLLGLGYAAWASRYRPDRFARIGRSID